MGLGMSAVKSAVGSVNVGDVVGKATSSMTKGMSNMIPKFEIPEAVKNWKPNIDKKVTLPPEIKEYIAPAKEAMSKIDLAGIGSAIGGLQIPTLPTMPDISTITNEAESKLSSLGIDLGFLDVSKITNVIKAKDNPTALLKSLNLDIGADIPDVNSEMKGFQNNMDLYDPAEMQSELDKISAGTGYNINVDISSLL